MVSADVAGEPVTTHIFDSVDNYLDSDTVFGVKDSLITKFERHDTVDEDSKRFHIDPPFCTTWLGTPAAKKPLSAKSALCRTIRGSLLRTNATIKFGSWHMNDAFICDAVRTPFGRYAGALAGMRTDDLAATALRALANRNPGVDWQAVDDVLFGCANQAGEDNRNVAPYWRWLLAGIREGGSWSHGEPALQISEYMEAVGMAMLAHQMRGGGPGHRGRGRYVVALFVMGKADTAFSRSALTRHHHRMAVYQSSDGRAMYARRPDALFETAENVAEEFKVSREDQDAFSYRTQQRWAKAHAEGFFDCEIVPVLLPQKKGDPKLRSIPLSNLGPIRRWRLWPGSSRWSNRTAR